MAVDYLGSIGLGATSPQLFRAGDGKLYVVKLQNNRLGPKVLANELVGARLGEMLDLCFPAGTIIKIGEELVKSSRRLRAAKVSPGRHFACQYLSGVRYLTPQNLPKAVNKDDLAGVMLFDHLLLNPDRTMNRKNLLLRREAHGHRIYAIDNSHLFRRAMWSAEWLKRLGKSVQINRYRTYGAMFRRFLLPRYFDRYLMKINGITDAELTKLVADIPQEWLPHASEREALLEFVMTRRSMADDIVTCLCALIPDKHRGANMDKGE
jgi:hypothetical protein